MCEITINLNNEPVMECLYFRVGQKRPLKLYINKLRKIANVDPNDLNLNKRRDKKILHKAYFAALKLSILSLTFDYMSRCTSDNLMLMLDDNSKINGIRCDEFRYVDPKTHEPRKAKGFELVKRTIVRDKYCEIVSVPIFELRINNIIISDENFDFGFRCIFFYTKHSIDKSLNLSDCQCYTNKFHKRSYKKPLYQYSGNEVTNMYVKKAYKEYKHRKDTNFNNEFSSSNSILSDLVS